MQESDCFITRLFAGLDASSAHDVMNGLHKISSSCETIHEWLVLHQHMIECVEKVKTDFLTADPPGKGSVGGVRGCAYRRGIAFRGVSCAMRSSAQALCGACFTTVPRTGACSAKSA